MERGKESTWSGARRAHGAGFHGAVTVGASPSHFVELLPREGSLHAPGPDRSLLLDGVLQHGLQREQHAEDVLGTLHAHIHHCRDTNVLRAAAQQPPAPNHLHCKHSPLKNTCRPPKGRDT